MFDFLLPWLAGGVLVLAGAAYLWGRRHERNRRLRQRIDAARRAGEIEDDIARRTPEQRRKDLGKWGPGAGMVLLLLVAACTTPGDFCDIAKPIRLSEATVAVMTDAEITQTLEHNEKLEKECGVRP